MKKQLLYTLSFVLLFCFSCTKEETKIQDNSIKTNNVTVVEDEKNNEGVEKQQASSKQKAVEKVIVLREKAISKDLKKLTEIEVLRKKHENFLNNSPFKKSMTLSKKERKALGIPPKRFFESEWELSMNPQTGMPDFENLERVRNQLAQERLEQLQLGRSPGVLVITVGLNVVQIM